MNASHNTDQNSESTGLNQDVSPAISPTATEDAAAPVIDSDSAFAVYVIEY